MNPASSDSAAPARIVILGFGPVAARLVDELLDEVTEGRIRLTIIGAESEPAYQRIRIGDVSVGRLQPEDLAVSDVDQLRDSGVTVHTSARATRIDRAAQLVLLEGGDAVPYDRLVLATGAEPMMPTLEVESRRAGTIDAELRTTQLPEGIMALREMGDALRLAAVVRRAEPVVVLGGGVLGVEAALAIAEVGSPVTLVHRGNVPMGRQIDTDAGMLLRRELISAGVKVRAAADITTVVSESGRLAAVRTSLGEKIPASLLVLCTGVRARDGLAADAGLSTRWGVMTDAQCRSLTDTRIFAIGDCATVDGREPSGLIAPGWQHAETAAESLCEDLGLSRGIERDASGTPVSMQTGAGLDVILVKSKTLNVACAGTTDVDPWDPDSPSVSTWSDPKGGQYLRIVSEQDRLLGFVSVGMPRSAAELAMHAGRGTMPVADRTALLAAEHATREAQLGPHDVLCRCAGTTLSQVEEAAACAASVSEVGDACRAGTGCGTCHNRIEKLLQSAEAQRETPRQRQPEVQPLTR
ncbi:FAD-dependent oxidoreductase [Nesterenkonia lutea]|uniref:Assimilatory nitrate reductase electron transfer subunit n=1 Tax=Nesterenkonia lutea TaxID=272919 RepID=A0ABR9JAQ4_9MICC|nr:FAD-dependent oxidoreductase [Nesterenkonia lutea]MBE1523015.1 assimilatory nitrate reductase electron transfer subunit [Nesterenkonia lutea]